MFRFTQHDGEKGRLEQKPQHDKEKTTHEKTKNPPPKIHLLFMI